MTIEESDYITFERLDFSGCCDIAFDIKESDYITFDTCSIGNVSGKKVIRAYDLTGFTFVNGEMYSFGETGIEVRPKRTAGILDLVSCETVIDNNYFHDFGFIESWSSALQVFNDIGPRVSHNVFERGAHGAIDYGDLIDAKIEYNVFDNMMMTTADFGAIYTFGSFVSRSNTIRYNLFKNIRSEGAQYGIYLDGESAGAEVYGNIFYKAGNCAVTINGGRDNIVRDNVYIQAEKGSRFLFCNLNQHTEEYLNGKTVTWEYGSEEMEALNSKIPHEGEDGYDVWSSRWPILYRYNFDFENLGDIDCLWTTTNNVSYNKLVGSNEIEEEAYIRYGVGKETNELISTEDNPCFRDPTHGDYTVTDGSVEISMEKIGRCAAQ